MVYITSFAYNNTNLYNNLQISLRLHEYNGIFNCIHIFLSTPFHWKVGKPLQNLKEISSFIHFELFLTFGRVDHPLMAKQSMTQRHFEYNATILCQI